MKDLSHHIQLGNDFTFVISTLEKYATDEQIDAYIKYIVKADLFEEDEDLIRDFVRLSYLRE